MKIEKRPTVRIKVWHLLVAAFVIGFIASFVHTQITKGASAGPETPLNESFDHSHCQYPERLSNPPNGCDNSDPARPECVVKSGTEDCNLPFPTLEQSAASTACKG